MRGRKGKVRHDRVEYKEERRSNVMEGERRGIVMLEWSLHTYLVLVHSIIGVGLRKLGCLQWPELGYQG